MKIKSRFWLLLGIVCLAAILRFYNLGLADVYTDEALIAFRSIGYIDFFSSPYQTTPWEWLSDSLPFWARLSFHDHPPLVFLIQHLFFVIFGVSLWVLRLPFVLAGLGSIILLFFIGQKLFKSSAGGLISSLLLGVLSYHVWISRIGLQESMVIFFCLLTFYLFLLALENNHHWPWGITLGLALLVKYTSLVLIPIFFCFLLVTKREVLKSKTFWLALIISILIFSPVIIYNLKLYQARGHFDLQFSYLFGQAVDEWRSLPGKEQAGSFTDRLLNLFPNLYQGLLGPIFILFLISLIFSSFKFIKERFVLSEQNQNIFLLILAIFFHLLLFLAIGPSKRFLTLIIPYVILLVTYLLLQQKKFVQYFLILFLVISEIFFSYNTLFVHEAWGKVGVTYSYLNIESYNYGFNQLDFYLDKIFKNKMPVFSFTTRYPFLEDIKKAALNRAENENKQKVAILLIYDSSMYDIATFWLFHRRLVYEGWPIITADEYLAQSEDFWRDQGIQEFYFIEILDGSMILQPVELRTDQAEILNQKLKTINPEIIKRPDGREVFAVYHW